MSVVLGVASACATTPAPSTAHPSRELDAVFAEIQVHETAIATRRATVENAQARCAPRCEANQTAGAHALQLCRLAEASGDVDARLRCDQARRMTAAFAAQIAQACRCEKGS